MLIIKLPDKDIKVVFEHIRGIHRGTYVRVFELKTNGGIHFEEKIAKARTIVHPNDRFERVLGCKAALTKLLHPATSVFLKAERKLIWNAWLERSRPGSTPAPAAGAIQAPEGIVEVVGLPKSKPTPVNINTLPKTPSGILNKLVKIPRPWFAPTSATRH